MRDSAKAVIVGVLFGVGCGVEIVDDEAAEADSDSESDAEESGNESTGDDATTTEDSSDLDSGDGIDPSDSDGDNSIDDDSESENSESESECIEGEFSCPCAAGDSCVPGLVCHEGLCVAASCGDGEAAMTEECDDGNLIDADGCNADCLMTEVVAIDAGNDFTCALLNSGDVKCWGRSTYGQLGQGNTNIIGDAETPASVPPIVLPGKASAITAGGEHACALLVSKDIACWGYGGSGRLGYANTANIGDDELPGATGTVSVGGPVASIVAGEAHTCVILESGYATCWGAGNNYQLGNESTTNIGDNEHPGSVGVLNLELQVLMISAGSSHTCAVRADGAARCWGHPGYGKLGYGNVNTVYSAANAGTLLGGVEVSTIAASTDHTCALLDTKQIVCWGYGNHGRLGYGNIFNIGDDELPDLAVDIPTAQAIALGTEHSCSLLESGQVACWGRGSYGKLGYGNTNTIGDDEMPGSVGTIDLGGNAIAITAGRDHSCALRDDHEVLCWGRGQYGALGHGAPNDVGDNESPVDAGPVSVF